MSSPMRVKGRPDFWLLADGDDCNDDQVTDARLVAAVGVPADQERNER